MWYWHHGFPALICLLLMLSIDCYYFGVGIYDITGPAAEINMMGYADPTQINEGIHTRLFSRAFIIKESRDSRPIVFINLDAGMVSQIVKNDVINILSSKFGAEFDHQNVLISATHTHSGPGGYFQYLLYTITSLGFSKQTFESLVDGIVQSVLLANSNIIEGRILIAEGSLYNTSINRSPASYLQNPIEEREHYGEDVDTKMTLLKFVSLDEKPVAMLNWFAVHPVSMKGSNKLISSDNKGLASILFEKEMNDGKLIGKGRFVGAFAQANEGDVSANINGPRCIDTGEACDFITNTCNGYVQNCIAFGPGSNMFESTKIIGQRQASKAKALFDEAKEELSGPISFIHQFTDMTNLTVNYNGRDGSTCRPAMGYSFAAGTMDGPGAFDFTQGTTKGSIFWNFIRDVIKTPSAQLTACHAPKPILLSTGEMNFPYKWQPDIVETQILRIGQLLIVAVPGEFTTMSGRRIRVAVEHAAAESLVLADRAFQPKFRSVIAGLSNVYSSYVTTYEEYQLQRYEGASTIYGPHTLQAYVKQFAKLSSHLITEKQLPPGPTPPYFVDELISLIPGVVFDNPPWFKNFGDVLQQPDKLYSYNDDVVKAHFVSANPRNNLRLNDTFLTVEKKNNQTGEWEVKFTDANWETKFVWHRRSIMDHLFGISEAIITWTVNSVDGFCVPGTYRILHFGTSKHLLRNPKYEDFVGITEEFEVKCLPRVTK